MNEPICIPAYCPECYYYNRENKRCALVGGDMKMSERLEQVKQLAGELLGEMSKKDILEAIELYLDSCMDIDDKWRLWYWKYLKS